MIQKFFRIVVILFSSTCVFILPGIRACDPGTSFGFPTVVMDYNPKPATELVQMTSEYASAPVGFRSQARAAWVINGIVGIFLLGGLWMWGVKPLVSLKARLARFMVLAYMTWGTALGWIMALGMKRGIDFNVGLAAHFIEYAILPYLWPLLLTFGLFNNNLYRLYDIPWETQAWFGHFFFHHDDILVRITFPLTVLIMGGIGWLTGALIERRRRKMVS